MCLTFYFFLASHWVYHEHFAAHFWHSRFPVWNWSRRIQLHLFGVLLKWTHIRKWSFLDGSLNLYQLDLIHSWPMFLAKIHKIWSIEIQQRLRWTLYPSLSLSLFIYILSINSTTQSFHHVNLKLIFWKMIKQNYSFF